MYLLQLKIEVCFGVWFHLMNRVVKDGFCRDNGRLTIPYLAMNSILKIVFFLIWICLSKACKIDSTGITSIQQFVYRGKLSFGFMQRWQIKLILINLTLNPKFNACVIFLHGVKLSRICSYITQTILRTFDTVQV